jgi:hypothetical protein
MTLFPQFADVVLVTENPLGDPGLDQVKGIERHSSDAD